MQVDIWSDIACPWCAVGKRRFEAALEDFEHRDDLAVRWRAFELDPDAPAVVDGDYTDKLAAKYGTSIADARAMVERMTATAAEEGWSFDFDRIRPGNTFDAHRLVALAADRGMQDAVKERFLSAYFEQGEAIGDHDVLKRVATEAGLNTDEVMEVLAGDAYAESVRADERRARQLGIRGVPSFVIDGNYGVSGAQPAEVLRRALEQAWEDHRQLAMVDGATVDDSHDHDPGEVCANGSCAI